MKILIYNSGGGLGDSIQLFDLITSLSEKFGKKNIYYLTAHNDHFNNSLKDYNIVLKELKTDISYFGFRFWHLFKSKGKILNNNLIDRFNLIIDLQSKFRNTIILKQFPSDNFYSPTFNFKFCNIKNDYLLTKYNAKNIISNLEMMLKTKILFRKYDINKIDKKFFDEAKRLLPDQNYVGFSITQGNKYRKKSWPLEKIINVAKQILKKNKKPVFLIEKDNTELINDIKNKISQALFPELKTTLSGPPLITALSTRLEKVVSIDNGIMHMIGLANIPMIVLFGPTNSKKFAPKIDQINILDSNIIYNTNDISKITENDVLNLI
tara:strand:+ start:2352 stop:3320 length:969 start_codon:yes stop_codon:yes gene_type:complete